MMDSRPRLRAIILSIVLISIARASLSAAPKTLATKGDSTAAELLTRGFTAYGAGDFTAATEAYDKFVADFGKSAEATQALPQILPLLARAQVHLGKWPEASQTIELFFIKYAAQASAATVEDLRFWEAVSLLRQKQDSEARGKFEAFIATHPQSSRLGDARLMEGLTYLSEEDFKKAGPYFSKVRPLLPVSLQNRAVLLELHARLQENENAAALRIVIEEYPHLADSVQIAGFEILTLQLGSDLLTSGEYRQSISALQRVWSADRIQKHSQERLAELTQEQASAVQRHLDPAVILGLEQDLARVKTDLATMQQIPNFDSARQLRLASAYQGMKRYREAALLMEQMLAEMPPDPLVEKASVNLVQCWSQIARWPKVIESADAFARVFPQSADLPLVLFVKAQALSADQRQAEAIVCFADVVSRFPRAEIAARSLFMKGYIQLINQENAAGIATLEDFARKYPKDALTDTAFYWRGMGISLAGEHEKARNLFADYLKRFPAGEHLSEARFRRAYDAQAQKQFDVSIPELQSYLSDFPTSGDANDARLLLGDALMAKGQVDEGIKALQLINPSNVVAFENGIFKIAKALRLQEKSDAMRAHLEDFLSRHPKSKRVAEAVYWVGWSWRQAEQPEKARDLYWQAIETLGNDPESFAVEDLLTGVARLYKGDDEKARLMARLRDLASAATAKKENTLAVRALWAQAQAVRKADPKSSDDFLTRTLPLLDVRVINPQILADCADALQRAGRTPEAATMYRDLVKWNPRAIQRDRAFAGLGQIALANGQEKEALDYFTRFEKETLGSPLFGQILLTKASLEKKRGLPTAAQATLEKLLANKLAGSKAKAEALCTIGDLLLEHDEAAKAVPYYQKIYVMYGRWSDFVARAYLGSGSAFEKLKNRDAAIKTYQEMAARPELAESRELAEARIRLARLEAGA